MIKKGFTLIETVIYIALFSILISGGFITAYQLLEGFGKLEDRMIAVQESNFVIRKINWALNGTSTQSLLITPNPSIATSTHLSLKRNDGTQINIRYNTASSSIEIQEGGISNPYLPLTTENVSVSYLLFSYLPSTGARAPVGIRTSFSVDGVTTTYEKYFRQ